MLEVTYTTTVDDYVKWNQHAHSRSNSMRFQMILSWAGLAVILLATAVWVTVNVHWVLGRPVAALGLVEVVGYPAFHRWWVGHWVRAFASDLGTKGVIGRITLVLTDDAMTERTEKTETTVRWRAMEGVAVVGDCTYIYVTGVTAAIIPRHGFDREEDYVAVRDYAVARLPALS